MEDNELLSTTQAAAIAGIHPGHLRRLLAGGEVLGAQKIGWSWIIPRDWAENFRRQRNPRK